MVGEERHHIERSWKISSVISSEDLLHLNQGSGHPGRKVLRRSQGRLPSLEGMVRSVRVSVPGTNRGEVSHITWLPPG